MSIKAKIVGVKLGLLQLEHNMNQEDIANILGITQSYLSRIKRGMATLNDDHIEKLIAHFGIEKEYFMLNSIVGEDDVKYETKQTKPNINNQNGVTMTEETLNRMLDIISRQQDDIHLAQINQAELIKRIPGGNILGKQERKAI